MQGIVAADDLSPAAARTGADCMPKAIYVLNGSNMNLLGTREPKLYGRTKLKDVEALCHKTAAAHGLAVEFRQSNHEGDIVDWIHEAAAKKAVGIVINGAGFTTTSISIHDAIKAVPIPVIECHITNIFAREAFRHQSVVAWAAKATMAGFGIEGYALAITALAGMTSAKSKR
jgi:3-dehydroquinate dehydratase-2